MNRSPSPAEITCEFASLDADTSAQLIALSRLWVEEDCSFGMIENGTEDLHEPLVVARDTRRSACGNPIVGYIFGHFYRQENHSSYIPIGSDCFSVDELYVLPSYRGRGIGKKLFRMLEDRVRPDCSYVTLATSTKNYQAILKLYIEELGMTFHSAFLIKDMKK